MASHQSPAVKYPGYLGEAKYGYPFLFYNGDSKIIKGLSLLARSLYVLSVPKNLVQRVSVVAGNVAGAAALLTGFLTEHQTAPLVLGIGLVALGLNALAGFAEYKYREIIGPPSDHTYD